MKTIIKNIQKEIGSAKVVVACSTGVDSMVLLDLVLKALPISQIIVCHVNHKIREASEAEQKFITKYSINHGLKLFVKQLIQYKGASYENWARNERYTFFNETAITQNATYILTAHQADDQFETILMRMLKGGNLKSYSGISELSKNGNIYIYRPLLTVSKEQIYEYARNNHITYYEDETNAQNEYLRNRIRHFVLPVLKEENSGWCDSIQYFHQTLKNTSVILEQEVDNLIQSNVNYTNGISFSLDFFLSLSDYIQKEFLFTLLKEYCLSRYCIDDVIQKIKSTKSRVVTLVVDGLSLIKEYRQICFTKENITPSEFYIKINEYGKYDLGKNRTIEVLKNICYFNEENTKLWYNICNLPLIVRTRKKEDRVQFAFGSQSVSDYLTNRKVGYLKRIHTLVLCDDSDSVLTILGYKIKSNCKEEKDNNDSK